MSAGETAKPTEDSAPSVCLCIPTFRRPQGLRKLLAHVAQLSYGGSFRIIVVENDARGQAGAKIVEELARDYPFPLTCVVEPERGHTFACNCAFRAACLDATPSTYIAMLDDDEYPEPNWLAELVGVALKYNAELVGGPVFPVFDAPEHWLVKTGVYAPTRFATGRVPMIYGSGNMMIRRSTLEKYLDEPFSNDFAFTGGGDEEFFWRCRREGRTFAWADDARVFETTPASRTTLRYLLRRRFRAGTGATRVERKLAGNIGSAACRWVKALGLIGTAVLSLPFAAFGGRKAIVHSLIIAARGTGRIAAEFGILYEEYR